MDLGEGSMFHCNHFLQYEYKHLPIVFQSVCHRGETENKDYYVLGMLFLIPLLQPK